MTNSYFLALGLGSKMRKVLLLIARRLQVHSLLQLFTFKAQQSKARLFFVQLFFNIISVIVVLFNFKANVVLLIQAEVGVRHDVQGVNDASALFGGEKCQLLVGFAASGDGSDSPEGKQLIVFDASEDQEPAFILGFGES